MLIVRHPECCPDNARGAVVALGNFDGVHLGHRAVIAETKRIAASLGAPAGVMTFDPHPREFFNPGAPPLRIYPPAVKEQLLQESGAEILYLLQFNVALANLNAEDFIATLLVEQLHVKHVITGADFAFGKGRTGNPQLLADAAARHGFGYKQISAVAVNGETCSSTRIRALLAEGEVAHAAQLLGRPYSIRSRVQHGKKRGAQLGFPTANLLLDNLFLPSFGVYAVRVTLEDGRIVPGVANLGIRPTVGADAPLLEVHCFDFAEDLYGTSLDVALVARLRPEHKFDSLDAMKEQIILDARQARQHLSESML